MTLRTINIIILFLCFNTLLGQTNLLIPKKGIEGISIVVDSSKISDVFKIYGTNYKLNQNSFTSEYRYEKLGLTFDIAPYDKNQIIRSISVESPYKAKTKEGIVLGESTMEDVWRIYNDRGCATSKSYAWNSQNGIFFYIKKDPNEKGYDANERIYKIEINNNGEFGVPSRANFEFNDLPLREKLNSLISILESENFTIDNLESFWDKEKLAENQPYGLKKQLKFKRKIRNNLIQENIEFRIAGKSYELIVVKSNKLEYLKLSGNRVEGTLFERVENSKIENQDFDTYIYGTFCGLGGIPPVKCKEMLELVKEKNYTELVIWLNSLNPEIAIYGYIGLEFLENDGIRINQSEFNRMKKMKNSDIQLNTCQGCMIGVTEKVKDVLINENINQIYESFKQSGWLK